MFNGAGFEDAAVLGAVKWREAQYGGEGGGHNLCLSLSYGLLGFCRDFLFGLYTPLLDLGRRLNHRLMQEGKQEKLLVNWWED